MATATHCRDHTCTLTPVRDGRTDAEPKRGPANAGDGGGATSGRDNQAICRRHAIFADNRHCSVFWHNRHNQQMTHIAASLTRALCFFGSAQCASDNALRTMSQDSRPADACPKYQSCNLPSDGVMKKGTEGLRWASLQRSQLHRRRSKVTDFFDGFTFITIFTSTSRNHGTHCHLHRKRPHQRPGPR